MDPEKRKSWAQLKGGGLFSVSKGPTVDDMNPALP